MESNKNLNKLLKLAENLICKLETLGTSIPNKIKIEKIVHSSTVFDGSQIVVTFGGQGH
mgnify:CR=1 FL=1